MGTELRQIMQAITPCAAYRGQRLFLAPYLPEICITPFPVVEGRKQHEALHAFKQEKKKAFGEMHSLLWLKEGLYLMIRSEPVIICAQNLRPFKCLQVQS